MKVAHKIANMFQIYPFLKQRKFPNKIKIVEVGPRDGLQNEKKIIPAEDKIKLINSLTDCGYQTIEATSFVSPKWVPQMADASTVFKGITKKVDVGYPVLVPNLKGFEQALEVDVKEISVFTAASEAFCKKNINCTIEESLVKFEEIIKIALQKNMKVRGYISCIMGCPYEGENIDPKLVDQIANKLIDMGCYEISLGDTIGNGTPVFYEIIEKTIRLMETLTVPKEKLAAHYHNTYDRGLENLIISMHYGISVIDSSIAGLGGCPYAKGASGNIPTEEVLLLAEILGIYTGIKSKDVCSLGKYLIEKFDLEKRTTVESEDFDNMEYFKGLLI